MIKSGSGSRRYPLAAFQGGFPADGVYFTAADGACELEPWNLHRRVFRPYVSAQIVPQDRRADLKIDFFDDVNVVIVIVCFGRDDHFPAELSADDIDRVAYGDHGKSLDERPGTELRRRHVLLEGS